MASALVAKCGICGTLVTSLDSSTSLVGGSRLHSSRYTHSAAQRRMRSIRIQAASKDESDKEKEKEEGGKTSLFTSITDALDFAQTRSQKDAELLVDARENIKSDGKMSREQYAALRRKVGGTYKDFFKDSIDVIGDYVDAGWVDKTCRVCKKDTSTEPRTKDSLGRYAHVACLDKEKSGNFFSRLFGR